MPQRFFTAPTRWAVAGRGGTAQLCFRSKSLGTLISDSSKQPQLASGSSTGVRTRRQRQGSLRLRIAEAVVARSPKPAWPWFLGKTSGADAAVLSELAISAGAVCGFEKREFPEDFADTVYEIEPGRNPSFPSAVVTLCAAAFRVRCDGKAAL
jgi:hypothetical protein